MNVTFIFYKLRILFLHTDKLNGNLIQEQVCKKQKSTSSTKSTTNNPLAKFFQPKSSNSAKNKKDESEAIKERESNSKRKSKKKGTAETNDMSSVLHIIIYVCDHLKRYFLYLKHTKTLKFTKQNNNNNTRQNTI